MLVDITMREAQDIAYDLFLQFDKICKENGLRYCLSGGTLLGAVRHKGFIPWDDDMDVMMPRKDYDRLLSLNLDLEEKYKLFSCETDAQYFYPFAKLCNMDYRVHFEHHIKERSIGMYIDIFPIEGLPDGKIAGKLYFKRMQLLNIYRNAALRKDFLPGERFRGIKKILMSHARRKGANYYAKRMNTLGRKYGLGKSGYAGVTMITHYGARERMPYNVFDGTETVIFRDMEVPAPKGWKEYLTRLYGDYMKLPPEDKRETDHGHFVIEKRSRTGGYT